jgi:iron complex transport system substrate-binding protein
VVRALLLAAALVVHGSPAAACQRLVVLAPSLVETVAALGLAPRLVGVGDHVRWPPEVAQLPRLGGLVDPRLETLVGLEPDLALLLPSEEELAQRLRRLRIEVLVLPAETLDDVERAVVAVGRRCGAEKDAVAFLRGWRRQLAPRPAPVARRRVLLVAGRRAGSLGGMFAAGPGTFLDELLERAGAANAIADSRLTWPQVSLEEVLARQPDLVVELQSEELAPGQERALLADWQPLAAALPAVRRGRVVVVDADWALLPGPRLPLLYGALVAALEEAP